ncbi:MAG: alpha/beta fold hydrolase [Candidatus Saganbacteria bacterium]|nr:alpha/beta fold hydrolase [Candidatus Saganbacteria bacterium]
MICLFIIVLSTACLATVNPATVSLSYLAGKKFDGRDLTLVKVLAEENSYTRYYITYKSGDLTISGIMNVPKGKGPYPVIITNHGYINTKYYTNGRGLKREQDYLAQRGYIVLHPDYRNHNGSSKDPDNDFRLYTGYIEDVINAVYAVKNSNFKFIDKDNIGMLGHSLGGGIALSIMAVKPKLIKAYVLFAPTSIDYKDNFERWIARRPPQLEESVVQKYGPPPVRHKIIEKYGSPVTNPNFWNGFSVWNRINNISDPVIVHQGTSDDSVPFQWSEKLEEALKAAGKDVTLYLYKGEKHEFISAWLTVMERSEAFFRKHL